MLVLASWGIKKVTLLGEPRKMSQHIEGPSTSPCRYIVENVPGALQDVVSTKRGHWAWLHQTWAPGFWAGAASTDQHKYMSGNIYPHCTDGGFPGGSAVKNPPAKQETWGSIPGSGRYPDEGNGNPLQYSCLKNPRNRGAWQTTVHGVTKELDMTEQLNNNSNIVQMRKPRPQKVIQLANSRGLGQSHVWSWHSAAPCPQCLKTLCAGTGAWGQSGNIRSTAVISKQSLPSHLHEAFPFCFLLGVLQFQVLHLNLYPFWVALGVRSKLRVQFHSFPCGCPVFPAPFVT